MAYGFYALCAVLSFVFVWKWVMETKGVSLEDMHGEILARREARDTLTGRRRPRSDARTSRRRDFTGVTALDPA